MASLYTQQGKNIRRTWLLMTVFLVVIIAVGYFVAWYLQNPGILYIAVASKLTNDRRAFALDELCDVTDAHAFLVLGAYPGAVEQLSCL